MHLKPSDAQLAWRLYNKLKSQAELSVAKPEDEIQMRRNEHSGQQTIAFVETAGGVLSPGPSGTPQVDIFRPLRLPVVLVGDHKLGGISATISAAESLLIRGYDIDAVVCFEDGSQYQNAAYLKSYFKDRDILTVTPPWIPDLTGLPDSAERERMDWYYKNQSNDDQVVILGRKLISQHKGRIRDIEKLSTTTNQIIWHPFTQHKHVKNSDNILTFDSAHGDFFQAKRIDSASSSTEQSNLFPAFDGSASWWTQGLGHGNPRLSLAAAYAAGRYGHVMFAGATHQPAVLLAEQLLRGLLNPRLSKVFYTDNGSTAVEVGIKMALRAACKRYEWDGSSESIGVIGLKGSYHGDTIGAMDASEPCVYNKKVDWYRGRGYWFDFPTVKMRKGRWVVEAPAGMEEDFGPPQYFTALKDIFDVGSRKHSPRYESYIVRILDDLVKVQGQKFGALVLEPVLLGAGGMLFA